MQAETDFTLIEEMFRKALAAENQNEFAVSMFVTIIKNDYSATQKAIQLILDEIKANQLPQSIKAVELLEECMEKSGTQFQIEISKYRFLNELSKLVSSKYLGNQTLQEIKGRIMDCFLLWIAQYPEKEKIKSVYECLKKEIVHSTSNTNNDAICSYRRRTDIVDKENEKKLKKLLQSTHKEDVKKANLLIQYMVKQPEKKRERVLQQKDELCEIKNTIQVFNEVIDKYIEEKGGDISLLKYFNDLCIRYKSLISKMPEIIEDSEEDLMSSTIYVNDSLLEVLDKYNKIVATENECTTKHYLNQSVELPINEKKNIETANDVQHMFFPLAEEFSVIEDVNKTEDTNTLDDLTEIFSSKSESIICLSPILIDTKQQKNVTEKLSSAEKSNLSYIQDPLKSIDIFCEDLMKSSIGKTNSGSSNNFKENNAKLTLNEMKNPSNIKKEQTNIQQNHADSETKEFNIISEIITSTEKGEKLSNFELNENKNCLTNLQSNQSEIVFQSAISKKINYLSEVQMNFDDIEPSNHESILLMDSKEGLKITMDFASNKPFRNTLVIVVSCVNQSVSLISDFQFDAFVSKPCKVRLLEKNGNSLPGKKPFGPPIHSLNQIMLIYNPTEKPLEVTFTLSYKQGEDPDYTKESKTMVIPYF